jgi:excisionase family DNA binding protein
MDTTHDHVAWYRLPTPPPVSPERQQSTGAGSPMGSHDPGRPGHREPDVPRPLARRTVTVEEAAAILGIGRSAAYEGVKRGHIPSIRVNRRVLVPLPALEALLGGR